MMKSMIKTIRKMVTNNGVLKLLALLIAAIIWLAVINVNDPTKTVTIYNVPIQITDEEAITDNDQIYHMETQPYVNVTVSGRRSVVKDLTTSSFTARASLLELSLTNSVPVEVIINNSNLAGKVSISKQSVSQIVLQIENVITNSYEIEVAVNGAVRTNYELDDISLAKNKVDITAPESFHDRIEKVVANVDIDGATSDFTDKFKIELYDSDGNVIKRDDGVVLSKKKVRASVSILKLKRVPLKVELQGENRYGYEMTNVSIDPEDIVLVGKSSVLDGIKEIVISGDDTDITSITSNTEKNINLVHYIPSGTTIRGDGEAVLTIEVEGDTTREFTIRAEDIEVQNLPQKLDAEITSDSVTIRVTGKERVLEALSSGNFKASINLKGETAGKKTVEVDISTPNGVRIDKGGTVKVKIIDK